MSKVIDKLKEDIIGHKQIIEQLEADVSRRDMFILDAFPAVEGFEVKRGWYGTGGISSFKVIIEVPAQELNKLVALLTHRKLSEDTWKRIRSDIKEDIRKEVRREVEDN